MTDAKPTTIAQRFLEQATATPDQPVLIFPDVTFSYGQLQSLVATVALRFRAAGLDSSKAVFIQTEDPAVALPAILAAALLGVRVNATMHKDDLSQVVVTTEAPSAAEPHVLVDRSFSPALFDAAQRNAVWPQSTTDADMPWFHCPRLSEGGAQPFVALSQGAIVARALSCRLTMSGQIPRVAVLFPPTSYHGLTRRLATLLGGGCLLESGTWTYLHQNAVTDVSLPAAAVPALAAVVAYETSGARCEVLGLRLKGSEMEALLRMFREVSVVLDLAETGRVAATTTIGSGQDVEMRKILSSRTGIVDLSGTPASVGRLRISRGEGADDWIAPGIAARQSSHGLELLGPVTGRETIFAGGKDLDAELLDRVISATDGVVDAVAFASPKAGHDEVLCLAIFEDGVNRHQVVRRVEHACRDVFGAYAVPAKIRPIVAIPRKADGRPDRNACAEMILRAAEA